MKTFRLFLFSFMMALIAAGCTEGVKIGPISSGVLALEDDNYRGLIAEDGLTGHKVIVIYEVSKIKSQLIPYQDPPVFIYGETAYLLPWKSIGVFSIETEPVAIKETEGNIERLSLAFSVDQEINFMEKEPIPRVDLPSN